MTVDINFLCDYSALIFVINWIFLFLNARQDAMKTMSINCDKQPATKLFDQLLVQQLHFLLPLCSINMQMVAMKLLCVGRKLRTDEKIRTEAM